MAIPSCLIVPFQFYYMRARGNPFPFTRPAAQPHSGGLALAFIFVTWLLFWIVNGATTCAVSEVYFGRCPTIREAFDGIRARIFGIIGLFFNVGIRAAGLIILFASAGLSVGVIFAVIAGGSGPKAESLGAGLGVGLGLVGLGVGSWLSMRYALAMQAMLLEDAKGRAAIRRSVQLSRGRRGPLFHAFLLTVVIAYAGVIVFQGPFYLAIALMRVNGRLPSWMALCLSASGSVGGAITGPLFMIVVVLFYYDLRIRKEGFDLQFMMTSLPEPKPTDSTPAN